MVRMVRGIAPGPSRILPGARAAAGESHHGPPRNIGDVMNPKNDDGGHETVDSDRNTVHPSGRPGPGSGPLGAVLAPHDRPRNWPQWAAPFLGVYPPTHSAPVESERMQLIRSCTRQLYIVHYVYIVLLYILKYRYYSAAAARPRRAPPRAARSISVLTACCLLPAAAGPAATGCRRR